MSTQPLEDSPTNKLPVEPGENANGVKLRQMLADGKLIIADGAAGTMLMNAGLPTGAPPELWNIEQPQQILKLHQSYLEAGAQIILTNTFGGNRIKLGKAGISGRVRELNLAGAAIARQAAGDQAFVAGDIGPTGEMMQPIGNLTYDEALEAFTEQATALSEGGVDALWVETMVDLEEARAAVTAARRVTDLPVFCSLSFGRKGRTLMGVKASQAAAELWPLGLAAIGANCGDGLDTVAEALRQMREVLPGVPLIAKPNAGLPELIHGQTVYSAKADEFASRAGDFIALGAKIVGGCCGSNPAYIQALAAAVDELEQS